MTDDEAKAAAERSRQFYESLTPAQLVEVEQYFAQANEHLSEMVEVVKGDIDFRVQQVGVMDPSVHFAASCGVVERWMRSNPSGNALDMFVALLTAAVFKLARASRAESNPLAHLEEQLRRDEDR